MQGLAADLASRFTGDDDYDDAPELEPVRRSPAAGLPDATPTDAELQFVLQVLADVKPPLAAHRRRNGRIMLSSVNAAHTARFVTTFSGDPCSEGNVLANVVQHFACAGASDAIAVTTFRDLLIHDGKTVGEPHVTIPPHVVDYRQDDARRELMLARRRAREAHGGPVIADTDDAELDAIDEVLSSVTFTWPQSTIVGLWGERWANVTQAPGGLRRGTPSRDGEIWLASDLGPADSVTGDRFTSKRWKGSTYFRPATPFVGDPFNRSDVLAAAARHIAWAAAHEALEYADVDGEPLYNPHARGEVRVLLPGFEVQS